MTDKRKPRSTETREKTARVTDWEPPSMLPTPDPSDGYAFRWIRIATLGTIDNPNVSSKFRQGYVPVKKEDHPEIEIMNDVNARFPDGIEVGGLILCKIPEEIVEKRNEYYANKAAQQMDSVDHNFMRESHSAMPLFSEKKSKTTFGNDRE